MSFWRNMRKCFLRTSREEKERRLVRNDRPFLRNLTLFHEILLAYLQICDYDIGYGNVP